MPMHHLLLIAAILLSACAHTTSAQADSAPDSMATPYGAPAVPDSIFDPVEKADYRLLHFWDAYDFTSPDPEPELERIFRIFAELYNYASDPARDEATTIIISRTDDYPATLQQFARWARRYLYDKESETYCARCFLPWAQVLSQSPRIDAAERTRYAYLLEGLLKNSPGMQASDFNYETADGSRGSLHSLTPAPYTLLVLFDPSCHTCHDLITRVQQEPSLMKMASSGHVNVLLADIDDDLEAFRAYAKTLPKSWTVGIDRSGIEENDLYIFESTPAVYLLDRDHRVILKDATYDDLVNYARSH